jgi:plastocyanin
MPRLTLAVSCAALALALGACGSDKNSQSGRDAGQDGATVTTNPTPSAGTSTQSSAAKSNDIVSVEMKNIKFVPHTVTVKVGQKITWTNNDGPPHNVTATKGATFKSDTINPGATFDYTPTKAGTIDYVCTIHPGQNGTITVTK